MRLILLSSLLLLGTFLANGHETDPDGHVLNSLMLIVMRLQREFSNLKDGFLTVHKARSFGSGSERLYVTNKEVGNFEGLGEICRQAGGRIPSPQLKNQNKAFANVLERHNKEAYLVVGNSANFTNWAEGQPKKADGTCVKADTHGLWHSTSCDDNLLVVCEFYFIL
uniref:Phospholipase A2 inhibitor alpha isoform n=1 Tax=Gloydius brevicaudus siniticus TaxID=31147 RepID=Q9PVT5_GLOBS|nr:phospholipase A2 inhibitor alpha isoform [Gloydius brevicaudus siniticus]